MSTYIFTDALDLLLYPRGRYYRTHRGRPISDEMGFLEAVFSFVLGDGNPNAAYEEERWQRVCLAMQHAITARHCCRAAAIMSSAAFLGWACRDTAVHAVP